MDEFTPKTDELEKYADRQREGLQSLAAGTVTQADLARRFNGSREIRS